MSFDFIPHDNLHPTGMALVTIDDSGNPIFEVANFRDCAYDFIEINEENHNLINADTDCLYFGTLAQRSDLSRKTIQSFFNRGFKYFADLNLPTEFL